MSTLREVTRLVQDIRDLLAGAAGSAPGEALAGPYARWRQEAATRLGTCAKLLAAGNEYPALQVAETEPSLLDLVEQLTFPEEPQWADYCRQHHLPAQVALDAGTLRALRDIYARGISAGSPYYRDYRAAVTSRNDDKALQIITSIARLNPTDADAQQELARWRNKKRLAQLEALKAALAQGDRNAIAALTDGLEALGQPQALAQSEPYLQGIAIRDSLVAEQAQAEAETLLNQAETLKQEDRWRDAAVSIAGLRSLQKEHALHLSAQQQERLGMLERFIEKRRADALIQQDFDKALTALQAFADKADTRLLTATTLTLDEAQELEATFADFWKRMERFQLPVPVGELARLQGIGEAIRREAARKRGTKRTIQLAFCAIGFALLCCAAWTGYVSWRAYDYVAQLNDLQSRRLAAATDKLVQAIPTAAPWGATSVPALRATMEEKRQWAGAELGHLSQTEHQLDELEKQAATKFADVSPASLHAQLEAIAQGVQALSTDLAAGPKDRLSQLQNQADEHFAALRTVIAEEAQKRVASLAKLVQALDFSKPVVELAATLAGIDDIAKELEKARHPEAPELSLPADLDVSAQKLQAQAQVYAQEMAALAQSKQAMAEAGKLETYQLALSGYTRLRFTEAGTAALVLADFPTPDSVGARLCFGGDRGEWELAKKEARTGCKFYPDDVTESELRKVMKLRDDPQLNTTGPPNAKSLLDAMLLHSLTDAAGEHYQKPLLGAMDSLARVSTSDPLVRTFLALNLYGVMKTRGNAWGLNHCPRLVQDMAELESILDSHTLVSGEWLLPAVHDKYALKLQQQFAHMAQGKTYMEQARDHLNWVSHVMTASLAYAGHVDESHALNLKPGGAALTQVWGLAEHDGAPMAVTLTDGAAGKEQAGQLRKWSPLFVLPAGPGS